MDVFSSRLFCGSAACLGFSRCMLNQRYSLFQIFALLGVLPATLIRDAVVICSLMYLELQLFERVDIGTIQNWRRWFTLKHSNSIDPIPSTRGRGLQCCSSWAEGFLWICEHSWYFMIFMWNVGTLGTSGWVLNLGGWDSPLFRVKLERLQPVLCGGFRWSLFRTKQDRTATEWQGMARRA